MMKGGDYNNYNYDDDVESVDLLQPSESEGESPPQRNTNTSHYSTTNRDSLIHNHNHHHMNSDNNNDLSLSQEQLLQHHERWNHHSKGISTTTSATTDSRLHGGSNHPMDFTPSLLLPSSLSSPSVRLSHGPTTQFVASPAAAAITTTTSTATLTSRHYQPIASAAKIVPSRNMMVQYSPATQTLNTLQQSQEMVDLLQYNNQQFSQLEYDVVNALVMTKKVVSVDDDIDSNSDDEDDHNGIRIVDFTKDYPDDHEESDDNEDDRNDNFRMTTKPSLSSLQTARNKKHRPKPFDSCTESGGLVKRHKKQHTATTSTSHTTASSSHNNKKDPRANKKNKKENPSITVPNKRRNSNSSSIGSKLPNPKHSKLTTTKHSKVIGSTFGTTNTTTQITTIAEAASLPKRRGRLADSERRDINQIDVKTGAIVQTFKSFSEAGQVNNFSRHIVSNILRGTYIKNGNHNQYKGWTFRYVDDAADDNQNSNKNNKILQASKTKSAKASTHTNDSSDSDGNDNTMVENDKPVVAVSPQKTTVKPRPPPSPKRQVQQRNIPILATKGTVQHTFPSILSASKKTLVPRKQIASIVRGEMNECNGWTFQTIPIDPDDHNNDDDDNNDDGDEVEPPVSSTTYTSTVPKGQEDLTPSNPHTATDDNTMTSRKKPSPPSIAITGSPEPSMSNDVVSTTSNSSTRHSKQAIPVEEYDANTNALLRTYRSLTMAAEMSGANRHIITAVLKGRMNHWNGLKWQYSKMILSESSSQILEDEPRTNSDMIEQDEPNVAMSSSGSTDPDRRIDTNEYIVENIVITKMGTLGISAKKVKAPGAVLSLLNISSDPNERSNLQVDSLVGDETSIARLCGIQAGDYLFASEEASADPIRDNYDHVVELLGRQIRPINLYAVRARPPSNETITKSGIMTAISTKNHEPDNPTSKESSGQTGTNETTSGHSNQGDNNHNDIDVNDLKTTLQITATGSTDELNESKKITAAGSIAPFCAFCNGQKTSRPIHHSWCPKNSHFGTSGADEVLAKIQLGLRMHCDGCKAEYESGRRVPESKHSARCNGVSKAIKPPPLINPNKDLGRDMGKTGKYIEKDNNIALERSTKQVEMGIKENKQSKQNVVKNTSKTVLKAAKSVEVKNRAPNTSVVGKKQQLKLQLAQLSDDESIEDIDNREKLNVTWEDCNNVWGYEGHHENDVVIYSTSNIGCHYETLLLDERYEIDPFMSCRQYAKTHSTPEEGYQAIVLQRDLLGRRPWGLTCSRHEFGGACLVDSVEPLSPADGGVSARDNFFIMRFTLLLLTLYTVIFFQFRHF